MEQSPLLGNQRSLLGRGQVGGARPALPGLVPGGASTRGRGPGPEPGQGGAGLTSSMSPPREHAREAAGPGYPLWGGASPPQQGPPRRPVLVGGRKQPAVLSGGSSGAAGGEGPQWWAIRETEAGVRPTTGLVQSGAGEHGG